MSRQYEFKDGHFRDAHNPDPVDTEPLPDDWRFQCGETWPGVIVSDGFGLCGCVDPDPFVPMVRAYLSGEWGRYGDRIINFNSDDPLQTLVAALCDRAGLTEHGGNVGGSWLRPEGERWLELDARDSVTVPS